MRFIYTKAFAIFAGCLCLLAILAIMQIKGWLEPIKSAALHSPRPFIAAAKFVTLPVKSFFSTIYELKNITKENAQLSEKVKILEQNLVAADQQARENEALRNELGFVKSSKYNLIPCTVLSSNPFGGPEGLVLNCGQGQGVEEGEAIISQGYMVGKITYVGPNSSNALLAVSSNFSTDAKVSDTDQSAIVRGSFGSGLILD